MQKPLNPPPTIGERIRRMRQEAGLSQRELGELVNVTQASVSHWETGVRAPEAVQVAMVARHCGVEDRDGLADLLLCLAQEPQFVSRAVGQQSD